MLRYFDTRPAALKLGPKQEDLFNRIEESSKAAVPSTRAHRLNWVMKLGFAILSFFEHLQGFVKLIGQVNSELPFMPGAGDLPAASDPARPTRTRKSTRTSTPPPSSPRRCY